MAGEQGAPRPQAEIEAELAELEQTRNELSGKWQSGDEESLEQPDPEAEAMAAEEAKATQKGWVPKEQYKGDPSKWVDAKTFNERGDRFVKNLEREVQTLRAKINEFEGTKKQLQKVFADSIKAKDVELQSALSALRAQRLEAQREGDDDLTIQLEDRIEAVRDERKKLADEMKSAESAAENVDDNGEPAARGPNAADPMLREWIEDGNDWFENDAKLRNYALALGEELIKGGFKQKGRPFLDKITEEMRVQFPTTFRKMEKKAEGERNNPADGGAPSSSGKRGNGKTERDLPQEDFKIMQELIADGLTTKEKFLASYFSR